MILELIEEAVTAGARRHRACEVAGLDTRTVERWRKRPDGDDLRRGPKTRPANALTDDEEAKIVELATAREFVGLSPHQLVLKLADMSIFVASESSVYRVLRRRRLVRHRDRSRPRTHHRPRELVAMERRAVDLHVVDEDLAADVTMRDGSGRRNCGYAHDRRRMRVADGLDLDGGEVRVVRAGRDQ